MFSRSLKVALLIGLAVHITFAEITPSLDDCDFDLGTTYTFGRSLGSKWCASQIKQGQFVSGLKMWSTEGMFPVEGHFRGMEIKYTNGETTMIGDRDGVLEQIEWDPSAVSLHNSDGAPKPEYDANLHGIRIVLSDTKDAGTVGGNRHLTWPYPPPETGITGTLLGFSGMYGANGIEQITYHVLKTNLQSSKLHDVELHPSAEELNAQPTNEQRGLYDQTILSGHAINPSDLEETFKLEKMATFTTTKTWTHTVSNTWHLGGSVEIEVKMHQILVDDIARAKLEFFWEHNKETSNLQGETKTDTYTYGVTVTVPPHKAVHVLASSIQGKLDVTWTGQLTMKFNDGKEFTIPADGTLKAAMYSDAWVRTENESIDDAVAAIKKGDGDALDMNGDKTTLLQTGTARRFVA